LLNWFLFLSSFVFPLLFRHCFIPVSLAHVVSSLAYPNLLGTKGLGCCCLLDEGEHKRDKEAMQAAFLVNWKGIGGCSGMSLV
jgi:hypothetical protein